MNRILFFCLIVFSSSCLYTQVSKETETSVNFKIKNFGVNVDGHFEEVLVIALFNSEKELINISAKIGVKSIRTGMESRDKHILKEDFFDVKNYTNILFKTISIKKESADNYLVLAYLTIKKTNKQIVIPIQVDRTEDAYTIISNFEINRKNFDVGGSGLVLGKTVKIEVKHKQYY